VFQCFHRGEALIDAGWNFRCFFVGGVYPHLFTDREKMPLMSGNLKSIIFIHQLFQKNANKLLGDF